MLRNGEEVLVPLDDVRAGDLFVTRPGEKVATDGIVEEGESAVDQSMLTGESVPVEIGPEARSSGDDQHLRPPDRPGDERRRRHGAGADREARRQGAGG